MKPTLLLLMAMMVVGCKKSGPTSNASIHTPSALDSDPRYDDWSQERLWALEETADSSSRAYCAMHPDGTAWEFDPGPMRVGWTSESCSQFIAWTKRFDKSHPRVIVQQTATPDSKCSNIVAENAEVNCK